jgi:hypothetical protein
LAISESIWQIRASYFIPNLHLDKSAYPFPALLFADNLQKKARVSLT